MHSLGVKSLARRAMSAPDVVARLSQRTRRMGGSDNVRTHSLTLNQICKLKIYNWSPRNQPS